MSTPRDLGWGDPYALTSADMVLVSVARLIPGHSERLVRVRNADVGELHCELVRRLHARGWPGPNVNTWGYNGRLKRWAQSAGQVWGLAPMSSVSDHAWGTGVDYSSDLNPSQPRPANPWAHTDMPRDTAAVAASLGMDWGGTWSDPYDPMHFGMAVGPAEVRRLADLVRAARAAGLDDLEEIVTLFKTAAEFEASMARAVATGTNAVASAWLPRMVAAMEGRPNSYFADAAQNDDNEAALLTAQRETNALLAAMLGPGGGSDTPPGPVG